MARKNATWLQPYNCALLFWGAFSTNLCRHSFYLSILFLGSLVACSGHFLVSWAKQQPGTIHNLSSSWPPSAVAVKTLLQTQPLWSAGALHLRSACSIAQCKVFFPHAMLREKSAFASAQKYIYFQKHCCHNYFPILPHTNHLKFSKGNFCAKNICFPLPAKTCSGLVKLGDRTCTGMLERKSWSP